GFPARLPDSCFRPLLSESWLLASCPLVSRTHAFCIRVRAGGSIGIFLEGDDLTVANREDVNEVAVELASVGIETPLIVAERNYFIALGHQLTRLEPQRRLMFSD